MCEHDGAVSIAQREQPGRLRKPTSGVAIA